MNDVPAPSRAGRRRSAEQHKILSFVEETGPALEARSTVAMDHAFIHCSQ